MAAESERVALVRKVLATLDLSQRAFAKLLGVPASTVNRWETGQRDPGAVGEALLALLLDNPTRAERVLRRRAEAREAETTPTAAGDDLGERVLAQVAKLERGPRGAKSAMLTDLRRAMRRVKRANLDAALRRLERGGRLVLGRAVDLGALTAGDRRAAIDDPARGLLLYAIRTGQ